MSKREKKTAQAGQELRDGLKDRLKKLEGLMGDKILDTQIIDQIENIKDLVSTGKDPTTIIKQSTELLNSILEKEKALNGKLQLLRDETDALQEMRNRNKVELEELEARKRAFDKEIQESRAIDMELHGKSYVDGALYLVHKLENNIQAINNLEEPLKAKGTNPRTLNLTQRKALREFGKYTFVVNDSRVCQDILEKIEKSLISLVKSYGGIEKLNPFEERYFIASIGLIKFLLMRFDLFDNFIWNLEPKPLELQRNISALIAAITAISSLDNLSGDRMEFAKISSSFGHCSLEEKVSFMIQYFEPEYIEKMDTSKRNDTLNRLLLKLVLSPERVMDQIHRWKEISPHDREKFLNAFAFSLSPNEKLQIAREEFELFKNKMNLQ